jgi:hypothetical protein
MGKGKANEVNPKVDLVGFQCTTPPPVKHPRLPSVGDAYLTPR